MKGSGRKKKREGLVEGPKKPKGEEEKGREHDCDVFGGRKGMKEGGMQQREEKGEEEEQIRGLVWLEKGKNGRERKIARGGKEWLAHSSSSSLGLLPREKERFAKSFASREEDAFSTLGNTVGDTRYFCRVRQSLSLSLYLQ